MSEPGAKLRVLVCGGRMYSNFATVCDVLDGIKNEDGATSAIGHVIQGGARGADRLGYDWARKRNIAVSTFNADWDRFGRRAGPLRNQQMLNDGKPDLVVAFPGGKGTADMVARSRAAGISVIEIDEDGQIKT